MQADSSVSNEIHASKTFLDVYGRIASAMCVVHCFIVSFSPAIINNVEILKANNEVLEWGFFGFAVFFAVISAVSGLSKHRNPMVLGCFAAGLSILILGRLSESMSLFEGGEGLSIAGGVFLFLAHMYSSRCCSVIDAV